MRYSRYAATNGGGRMSGPSSMNSRMAHFHQLTRQEQARAIRHLAAEGWSEYGISHATELAIEQIRRVLGDQPAGSHANHMAGHAPRNST
jgi:hypothetical protein